MQFKLFDSLGGAGQIGSTITDVPVTVTQGVFSVKLDFGSNALSGANRWLEIAVRHNSGESYTTLSPREQIASSPYSVRTLSAAQADTALDSQKLGGVAASEYVTNATLDTTAIRNQTAQQAPANFNISGNGIVGGNVGIGTPNPAAKLDVRGNLVLEAGGNPGLFTAASGGEQNRFLSLINSPTTLTASGLKAGGILVSDDYFFGNPGKNDLIVKGNVGIGTATPTSRLNISALGYGFTQTSGSTTVGSYVDSAAGWYGTRSNHPLNFFTNDGLPQMRLLTNGNVGIGTTTPLTRLGLSGGPAWTSANWIASLSLQNGSAIGWSSNGSGRFGIGQSNGGLYFFRTIAEFGTNSTGADYDIVISNLGNVGIGTDTPTTAKLVVDNYSGVSISTNGHAKQQRQNGGWVKAMVYVSAAGAIVRCYNGVIGLGGGFCGFTVSHFATGGYNINFGFQVNDRYGVVTADRNLASLSYGAAGGFENFIQVQTFDPSGTPGDEGFTLIVY